MSYTTIKIAGKDVGLEFGYLSYKLIMTDKNRSLMFDEDGSPNDIGVSKIIYSGYQNNCINKNAEVKIPFDEFSREVDRLAVTEDGIATLTAIIKVWSDSTDVQALIKDTDEKKSQLADQSKETLTELSKSPTESLESVPGS